MEDVIPCTLKMLPQDQWIDAAKIACAENPNNAPPMNRMSVFAAMALLPEEPMAPDRIAVLTSKYWSAKGIKLGVSFMDGPEQALKSRILLHMNAWSKTGNVLFYESAHGEVRIARETSGYWSYLGTDVLLIPMGQQTMNLEGFTMNTSEAEFARVVRHETGHTMGFPHEHMRKEIVSDLDVAKTINYFNLTQGWTATETRQQVLTPIEERSLFLPPGVTVNPADPSSIMCYRLPASITKSGKPIPGGNDINENDYAFCGKIYPKPQPPPPPSGGNKIVLTFQGTVPPWTAAAG